jgi:Histidine kinase
MLLLGTVGTALGAIVIALWSGAVAAIAATAFHAGAPTHSLLGRQTTWALIGIAAGGLVLAVFTVLVTQHRLSYIAIELDRARAKLADDPDAASELLTRAHEESKKAMGELRDLVRGIHPSVLTDRGLDAAVSGLAERCPVPVNVDASNPTGPLRLSSGDGDVNALGIRATNVTLQSGNGDVTATFDRAPTRLDASSGNGDVTIQAAGVAAR